MRRVLIMQREADDSGGGDSDDGGGDSDDGGDDNDDGATDDDEEEVQLLAPALPKQGKASASRSKKQLRVHTAGHSVDNTASSDHDSQRLARRKNGAGGGDSEANASAHRRAGQVDSKQAVHAGVLGRRRHGCRGSGAASRGNDGTFGRRCDAGR
jgi:hypothetical protein